MAFHGGRDAHGLNGRRAFIAEGFDGGEKFSRQAEFCERRCFHEKNREIRCAVRLRIPGWEGKAIADFRRKTSFYVKYRALLAGIAIAR